MNKEIQIIEAQQKIQQEIDNINREIEEEEQIERELMEGIDKSQEVGNIQKIQQIVNKSKLEQEMKVLNSNLIELQLLNEQQQMVDQLNEDLDQQNQ